MIILEIIGFILEAIVLAIWRSRPIKALRDWLISDQDLGGPICMLIVAFFWLILLVTDQI